MPDQSIRSYIAALLQQGEIVRFTKEIDPDENLSAVGWRTYSQLGKGCLFEKVKGHPGWRVVSQIVADRRKWGVALGVSEDEVVATLNERMGKTIDPVLVGRGQASVKEVVRVGSEVNLHDLPAMWTSEADPGRYIAAGMCIIKDPHTGIRNVSFHRAQIVGPDRTGYLICPRQALKIYQMYGELKRPMEAAMVIGANPLLAFCAGYVAPYGQDEFAIAGGLLGEAVRMVKCETIDMEVPADAEIVLEGELRPGEMTEEGPFGEVTGGYAQEGTTPLFRIKAITHRKDPIFYAMQCGLPPSDAHSIVCTTIEMKLWQHLRGVAGGLDLLDVRCISGMSPMMVVLKLRPKFPGQARAALLAVLSSPYLHPKIAVAVDEDIDIRDLNQVYWAMTNRARRADDVQKVNRARVFALDNASPIEEGMSAMYRVGTKVLIDATEDPDLPPPSRARCPVGGEAPYVAIERERLVAGLGLPTDGLVAALTARLRESEGATPASPPPWREAAAASLLAPPAGGATHIGAVLAVARANGEEPLLGVVEVRPAGPGRFALGELPWRLARLMADTAGGDRPAALIVGTSAAATLGAALDGWMGRGGWQLAAALSGSVMPVAAVGEFSVPVDVAGVVSGRLSGGARAPILAAGNALSRDGAAGPAMSGIGRCEAVLSVRALATDIIVAEHLRQVESGLDILDVRCYPQTGNRLVVVKIRPRVEGQSKTACMAALSSPDIGPALVIAVDDDIDTGDLRDVSWSFASRLHAEHDVASLIGLPELAPQAPGAIVPGLKWFVDATKPPLTQTVNRADFDRAMPKNLAITRLEDFLPD